MARVFLIHGWQGKAMSGWRPWLKQELEQEGATVFVPQMPNPDFPKESEWVEKIAQTVGVPSGKDFFVGHSLGCIAILRYLETISSPVGGAVLVAGVCKDLGIYEHKDFFARPIAWKKIRSACKNFVAVNSDDDPYIPLEHAELLRKHLGAKVVVAHGMKHFSGSDGFTQVPIVLQELSSLL